LQHMGELPEQIQANLKTLDRLQSQFQASIDAVQHAQERKLLIERSLASFATSAPAPARPLVSEAGSSRAVTAPEDPAVTQRRALLARQAELSTSYKEDHPDIIKLRKQIAQLDLKIAAQPKPAPPQESPEPAALSRVDVPTGSLEANETQRRIA